MIRCEVEMTHPNLSVLYKDLVCNEVFLMHPPCNAVASWQMAYRKKLLSAPLALVIRGTFEARLTGNIVNVGWPRSSHCHHQWPAPTSADVTKVW